MQTRRDGFEDAGVAAGVHGDRAEDVGAEALGDYVFDAGEVQQPRGLDVAAGREERDFIGEPGALQVLLEVLLVYGKLFLGGSG